MGEGGGDIGGAQLMPVPPPKNPGWSNFGVGMPHPNITQPNTLKCGAGFDAAPMRLRGGSDASSGGLGWVGAKIAPYFFDWVGPYLIS
jgi:hypothetical protein